MYGRTTPAQASVSYPATSMTMTPMTSGTVMLVARDTFAAVVSRSYTPTTDVVDSASRSATLRLAFKTYDWKSVSCSDTDHRHEPRAMSKSGINACNGPPPVVVSTAHDTAKARVQSRQRKDVTQRHVPV